MALLKFLLDELSKMFLDVLFAAEKENSDASYTTLCQYFLSLLRVAPDTMLQTLYFKIFKPAEEGEDDNVIKQNRYLLQSLTLHIVKEPK